MVGWLAGWLAGWLVGWLAGWLVVALVCFGLLWFALVCFGLLWFALVCFGLLWFALVCFGLLWFAFPCSVAEGVSYAWATIAWKTRLDSTENQTRFGPSTRTKGGRLKGGPAPGVGPWRPSTWSLTEGLAGSMLVGGHPFFWRVKAMSMTLVCFFLVGPRKFRIYPNTSFFEEIPFLEALCGSGSCTHGLPLANLPVVALAGSRVPCPPLKGSQCGMVPWFL